MGNGVTMISTSLLDDFNATSICVVFYHYYDKRFKSICKTKEVCFTEYLFNKSLNKITKFYSQYGDIEVHTYTLENKQH